jgi:hypothetical protein
MWDMNTLFGDYDIVFLTLDTLRYDVAARELASGNLPVLSQHITDWEQRHSPGSFTYAAHHAFFSGFFPTPVNDPTTPRPFAVSFAGSTSISEKTKCFNTATIVEGAAQEGYHTICIGGVGFFNKKTALGSVLPELFLESHWHEGLGVTCKDSTEQQVAQAISSLNAMPSTQRAFLFINVSAIHQPNYFYRHDDADICKHQHDDLDSHAAALRYVDTQLNPLLETCKKRRNTMFFICSDHGTTYGEDGYSGHRLAHEHVWTVPFAQFIQKASDD